MSHPESLHSIVIRAASTLWRYPGDDLIRILNIAGLAVDAIGGIKAYSLAIRGGWVVQHFIDIGWAKMLTGASEFTNAT